MRFKSQALSPAWHKIKARQAFHAADRQIDRLVYELYGLTEAEIRIVEEGSS